MKKLKTKASMLQFDDTNLHVASFDLQNKYDGGKS